MSEPLVLLQILLAVYILVSKKIMSGTPSIPTVIDSDSDSSSLESDSEGLSREERAVLTVEGDLL